MFVSEIQTILDQFKADREIQRELVRDSNRWMGQNDTDPKETVLIINAPHWRVADQQGTKRVYTASLCVKQPDSDGEPLDYLQHFKREVDTTL